MDSIDLRLALNAISDVVQNRPPPIRNFDQIYMKVGDMALQAVYAGQAFADRHVVFIGDGDSIALSVLHLHHAGIIREAPQQITVLDFDERIVNAINTFSEDSGFSHRISARLYNVVDPVPSDLLGKCDGFYTNPPWGQSNDGESVLAFIERGMECCRPESKGMFVIADDPKTPWTQLVLRNAQRRALDAGYIISEMLPQQHLYHLDDAPDLTSCSCLLRRTGEWTEVLDSRPLSADRRANFYGRGIPLAARYIREPPSLNRGRAQDGTYQIEALEE